MRKKLCYLELLISIILFSLFFFGEMNSFNEIIFNDYLKFLPYILLIVLTLLYSLHYFFFNEIFKVIFIYIALFITSLVFLYNINTMNAFCLFFGLFSLIINFVSIIVEKDKVYKYKVGYFSIKQVYFVKGFVLSFILITIFFMVFTTKYLSLWLQLLIVFIFYIISLIIALFIFNKIDPLKNIINKFKNNLDYNEFNNSCLNLLKNESLNKESIIYIKIMRINYMLLKDKEEASKLFNELEKPTYKKYSLSYDFLNIIINKKRINFQNKKINSYLNYIYDIYFTDKNILNVTYYYDNAKTLLDKLIIANDLCYYFNRIKDKENAILFANFILENNKDFDELHRNANNIIKLINENSFC